MSVLSFPNYTPPPRYDDLPWTIARIQSSSTEGGTYALVVDITLDPVDDNPAEPITRSFTTELGTASLWYRILWVDGSGDTSLPTVPGQNTTGVVPGGVTPYATAAELAAVLKVSAVTYATALDQVLEAAALEINAEVGRTDLAGSELPLAAQVNIERAVEHWHARPVGFGIVGLDSEAPIRLASDSWNRHANKLAPIKGSWGLATLALVAVVLT